MSFLNIHMAIGKLIFQLDQNSCAWGPPVCPLGCWACEFPVHQRESYTRPHCNGRTRSGFPFGMALVVVHSSVLFPLFCTSAVLMLPADYRSGLQPSSSSPQAVGRTHGCGCGFRALVSTFPNSHIPVPSRLSLPGLPLAPGPERQRCSQWWSDAVF